MEKSGIQVIRLVDLADYQEGPIVSRTIIDKKTGTVTFFAFDKGQGLSEHTAPFDALVYLLDGEAEVVISGKPFRLKNPHFRGVGNGMGLEDWTCPMPM
jgi:quercetin dioxygenase-like cupin family protein